MIKFLFSILFVSAWCSCSSQDLLDLVIKSNFFDTIPSCEKQYFIETTELIDSTYQLKDNALVERTAGELSILELTNNCSVYFKIEVYKTGKKKFLLRLGQYKHTKTTESITSILLIYAVDFKIKQTSTGFEIVKIKLKS